MNLFVANLYVIVATILVLPSLRSTATDYEGKEQRRHGDAKNEQPLSAANAAFVANVLKSREQLLRNISRSVNVFHDNEPYLDNRHDVHREPLHTSGSIATSTRKRLGYQKFYSLRSVNAFTTHPLTQIEWDDNAGVVNLEFNPRCDLNVYLNTRLYSLTFDYCFWTGENYFCEDPAVFAFQTRKAARNYIYLLCAEYANKSSEQWNRIEATIVEDATKTIEHNCDMTAQISQCACFNQLQALRGEMKQNADNCGAGERSTDVGTQHEPRHQQYHYRYFRRPYHTSPAMYQYHPLYAAYPPQHQSGAGTRRGKPRAYLSIAQGSLSRYVPCNINGRQQWCIQQT